MSELYYKPSCEGKRRRTKSEAVEVAKRRTIATGSKIRAYPCAECQWWHVGHNRHIGRLYQPHNACDKCGQEIRVKRYIKHVAKCTGFASNEPHPGTALELQS